MANEVLDSQRKDEEASATMLTITPQALTVIQRVSAHPSLEPNSGLRIACQETGPSAPLGVRAVHGPSRGDRVWEQDGARLFLGPRAAQRIAGRELDAITEPEGHVQFVLRPAA